MTISPSLSPIRDHRRPSNVRPTSQRWSLWCCAGLVAWGLLSGLARSEEDAVTAGKPGVLLLEGNRVIVGRITPQGDTYSVAQSVGTLVVAKQQVHFVGVDMNSVYVHLQDALPNPPAANDHVELARWCVGYRMLPEARFELQAALEVDPSRDDIRRNLNQLDSLLKQPVVTESKPVKSETPAQRMAKLSGLTTNDVESLGGLSREAGREFTRHIQPILMHNCTASACHGSMSEQTLKFNLVRQGSSLLRSTTEKNLLALLPHVDREDPKSGKLWKLLKTNHGARGSSIFLGTKGKDQLTAFQDWLLSLEETDDDEPRSTTRRAPTADSSGSREKTGNDQPRTAKSRETTTVTKPTEQKQRYRKGEHTPPAVPAGVEEESEPDVVVSKPRPTSKARATSPTPSPLDTEPIVSEELPELPDAVTADPFNPDEFNRLQRGKVVSGSP